METMQHSAPASTTSGRTTGSSNNIGVPKVRTGAIPGMEGGAGEFSYTRNSRIQSQAIAYLKPVLQHETWQLNLDFQAGPVRVADLGCSVGSNTISYAEILFQYVQERCRRGRGVPDVQYFFSDLPSNDFNTLFQQLEEMEVGRGSSDPGDGGAAGKKFFAAAVPGSFYGRLFPAGSLHVVISTFALMWISQVPDAVKDKSSAAYNKGRVWIDGASPAVVGAFAQTSAQDLHKFFESRAHEMASGGLVVLNFLGREDGAHPERQWVQGLEHAGPYSKVFEDTWEELVAEGIIDEETRDNFNIPVYLPGLDEIRAAVDASGAFHMKRLELREQPYFPAAEEADLLADPAAYGHFTQHFTKSMVGSYIELHIGTDNAAEFFERLRRRAAAAARAGLIPRLALCCVLVVLIRK